MTAVPRNKNGTLKGGSPPLRKPNMGGTRRFVIETTNQVGVMLEVTEPDYRSPSTNTSVAGIRIETRNNNAYALMDVDELEKVHAALGDVLRQYRPTLPDVDSQPHLDELDEIDATLGVDRKDPWA